MEADLLPASTKGMKWAEIVKILDQTRCLTYYRDDPSTQCQKPPTHLVQAVCPTGCQFDPTQVCERHVKEWLSCEDQGIRIKCNDCGQYGQFFLEPVRIPK